MIESIQIEFVIPSGNSLQTPISIVKIQISTQLSKRNTPYMPSQHSTEEKQHHMSRPTNVSTNQQLNGISF